MDADAEFEAFVRASYAGLVRAARLLLQDPSNAEDLVQSALERTYSHWGRLRRPQAAESYARTTLVRLAIRASRRRWTGERPHDSVPERPGPDLYADHDTVDQVRRALADLTAEQREVLVLRFLLQLTEDETARVLRCPAGTVKSRTHRAIRALRASGLLEDSRESTDG